MQVADKCIAVVDDDASVRSATVDLLASVGFACKAFEGAEDYLRSAVANRTACLILDVRMPGLNGLELQRLMADQGRAVPIIFITSYPNERVRRRAIRAGAICYLSKPYSEEDLLGCIRLALDKSGSKGR